MPSSSQPEFQRLNALHTLHAPDGSDNAAGYEIVGLASQLFETSRDAILILGSDLRIADWNPRADELFGISQCGPDDRTLERLIRPSGFSDVTAAKFHSFFAITQDNPLSRHFEARFVNKDGRIFPAEATVSRWEAADGWRFSLFVRDISERQLQESERREAQTRDVVIFAMARLAESRDPETGAHIERVSSYCQALAERLAVAGPYQAAADPEFVQLMYATSPLHDIGKVGIPDDILLKPGRLSDREFEVMKMHAQIGADTLDAALLRFPDVAISANRRNIAATHHERFDGTGYPNRLKGRDIPLCGRIAALADVYDALTSRRVYKAAIAHDVARGIIIKESGTHFDPAIVDAYLDIEATFKEIHQRYANAMDAAA